MGKGAATFFLVLVIFWLIAPQQTEDAIGAILTAIASRAEQSAETN